MGKVMVSWLNIVTTKTVHVGRVTGGGVRSDYLLTCWHVINTHLT